MMKVSMHSFLRTGVFGAIHLGMRHADVRALLGEPDVWGGSDTTRRKDPDGPDWGIPLATSWEHAAIWTYGNIELHFWVNLQDVERLALIYRDDLWALDGAPLSGGGAMQLDPWFIRSGMPRSEVERQLTDEGIPFSPLPGIFDDTSRLRVGPGVELSFSDTPDARRPVGLDAFSYCVRDLSKDKIQELFPDDPAASL